MKARLINLKTGEHIILSKPVFRIGRDKAYVDFYIADSSISRSHCILLQKNDGWDLVDCNATNHTYIDGQQVPPNIEVPLYHNSEIYLANIPFRFEEVL